MVSGAKRIRVGVVAGLAGSLLNFRGPLIRRFVASGFEVFALAPDFDDSLRESVRALGAEPVDYYLARTGVNPLQDMASVVSLLRAFRRLRLDVTFCYTIKPVTYGTLAAWLARVPRRFALVTGLGYAFTEGEGHQSVLRRSLRRLTTLLYWAGLSQAERVFFQNNEDREFFVSKGLVIAAKCERVFGTGVDLDEWRPQAPVETPVTFVLAARLIREKGVAEFVEAARRVKGLHPQTRFFLLGSLDANPGSFTRRVVEGWATEGVVEWSGGSVDVKPWFTRASVYVLPSFYREGVPRSTQEALAMARPVITTDAPGCRDTVVDGVNGFLVPVRDADALSAAMLRFVEDPQLISRMGRASRELAEARFDVNRINDQLLAGMGLAGDLP